MQYTSQSLLILVFSLLCILNIPLASATISPEIGTLDTQHFIPPVFAKAGLRGGHDGGDVRDHYLVLSTPEQSTMKVRIRNANNSVNKIVKISRDSPAILDLSAAPYGATGYDALNIVSDDGVNTVNREDGLILSANGLFSANIRHASGSQGASLVSKGRVALGTRFRTGHMYTSSTSPELRSHFIAVMASKDDTHVNFSDLHAGITFVAGTPSSIKLDQYESYVAAVNLNLAGNATLPNALNGTLVTSNKDIVVNTGSFLGGFFPQSSARDIGVEQTIPTDYFGKEFIAVKGSGDVNRSTLEVLVVVADSDNTKIFLNGQASAVAKIHAGEVYTILGDHFSNGFLYIQTSHPAAIYQTTSANDRNGMDMNFLPALTDVYQPRTFIVPEADQLGETSVSIVTSLKANIKVNEVVLDDPKSVTGTEHYVVYHLVNQTGHMLIESDHSYTLQLTNLQGNGGASAVYTGFPNSYAVDDVFTVRERAPITLDVLANDVVVGEAYSLGTSIVHQPQHGIVSVNAQTGMVVYTPNDNFMADQFSYQVLSGSAHRDHGLVTLYFDTDGDSIGDFPDLDTDGDGILDEVESGFPPLSGQDSDGDGIDNTVDVDVTGGIDDNQDNIDDRFQPIDTDGDGVPNYLDTDSDGDTIPDGIEGVGDVDGDAIANYLDLDSDNDGIPDIIEAIDFPILSGPDQDFDGIDDSIDVDQIGGEDANNDGIDDAKAPSDVDSDGLPNYQDTDSDGDTIVDSVEGQVSAQDSDGDQINDKFDVDITFGIDANNDGVDDSVRLPDFDSDGAPDVYDVDSDGDGLGDAIEYTDANLDGISDHLQVPGGDPQTEDGLKTAVKGSGGSSLLTILGLFFFGMVRCFKGHGRAALCFSLSLFVTSAHAQFENADDCGAPDDYRFNSCFFIGGGLGLSHLDPEGSSNGFSTDDSSSAGWSLHIGKHFKPHWYWTLQWNQAGEAGLGNSNPVLDATVPDAHIDYMIPSLMVGYNLWHDTHWNVYGKFGISAISTEANDVRIGQEKQSSVQLALGGGIVYHFDSPWFVKLDFMSFDRDAKIASIEISRYFQWKRSEETVLAEPQPVVIEPVPIMAPVVFVEPESEPEPEPVVPTDIDMDGVLDEVDQCPKTHVGLVVDELGCPVLTGVIKGVNFHSGKAALTPKAEQILDSVVQTLQSQPALKLVIKAHTDSQGSVNSNRLLSKSRGMSVRGYLILQGIDSTRLRSEGYGESQPISDNGTAEGRLENRRVEFSTDF